MGLVTDIEKERQEMWQKVRTVEVPEELKNMAGEVAITPHDIDLSCDRPLFEDPDMDAAARAIIVESQKHSNPRGVWSGSEGLTTECLPEAGYRKLCRAGLLAGSPSNDHCWPTIVFAAICYLRAPNGLSGLI